MNWRKGESNTDVLERIGGRGTDADIAQHRYKGTWIDTSKSLYVEAVAKARESGRLYEGLDMRVSIARAKAEKAEKRA